jgi:hypothetical protein
MTSFDKTIEPGIDKNVKTAKDIVVQPISGRDATKIVQRFHYSGKAVQNSNLHFGVFLDGEAEGALQFGPSLDKRKTVGLVRDTAWHGYLELNRMAFSPRLPRNSESRSLAISFRLIRKHYPHIEWILSYADGTQSGDGTIYRAAGFVLTLIKPSRDLARLPSGEVIHSMVLKSAPGRPRAELGGKSFAEITGGSYSFKKYCEAARAEVLPGFQLRYIYFLNPAARARLAVPEIPYAKIDEIGAGMYLGKKRTREKQGTAGDHPEADGAAPILPLQDPEKGP